jgi:hypothetical protein
MGGRGYVRGWMIKVGLCTAARDLRLVLDKGNSYQVADEASAIRFDEGESKVDELASRICRWNGGWKK